MGERKTHGSFGGYSSWHNRLEPEEPIQILIKRKPRKQYSYQKIGLQNRNTSRDKKKNYIMTNYHSLRIDQKILSAHGHIEHKKQNRTELKK